MARNIAKEAVDTVRAIATGEYNPFKRKSAEPEAPKPPAKREAPVPKAPLRTTINERTSEINAAAGYADGGCVRSARSYPKG